MQHQLRCAQQCSRAQRQKIGRAGASADKVNFCRHKSGAFLAAEETTLAPLLNSFNQAVQQLIGIADHVQPLMLMLFQGVPQFGFQL